ncbi:MAG: sulfite exporter TauE/SafE family protein [Bacteroidota bacterium]
MPLLLILVFIIAIAAFAISAICGGGASFVLLPLLGIMLPGAQVPAALSIGTAANSISRIGIFWKHIRWDIVVYFLPPALPAVYFGSKLLTIIDPIWLELFFGFFLIINLPMIFKSKNIRTNKGQTLNSKIIIPIIGLFTGLVSGLTGAVGLLFNRFYLSYGLTKEQIVATRAANELLLHIIKLILYLLFGLLTYESVSIGLVISISAIIASFVMKKFLYLLSENTFRTIGFSVMVLAGVVMMVNTGFRLHNEQQIKFSKIDDGLETKLKWNHRSFLLEFKYNDGFEIERPVALSDLPLHLQQKVAPLSKNADKIFFEEVYAFGDHYYEVYLYHGEKLTKYNFK